MPDPSADTRLSYLRWLFESEKDRQSRYRQFRDSYDGQRLTLLIAHLIRRHDER